MRIIGLLILLIGFNFQGYSQEETLDENFSLQEFLAMVKKYHPVVAQANLKLSSAEAKLLKARGAFDPTLEGNAKEKDYTGTDYYSLWNGSFKIPTWYGVDLKAGYEKNDGYYLNPQNTTPQDGLWNAGVSIQLAKGLLYNDRMNALRQAKILQQKNELERNILINSVLAEATRAYADWQLYYQNKVVFENFLENAQIRFRGISRTSELGETPAIDTVESKITVRNRQLDLTQANLKLQKAKLMLSNFLWIEEIPVELQDNLVPEISPQIAPQVLGIENFLGNAENLNDHPEIQSLEFDIQSYDLDIKLRKNNLLPKINIEYNFLTQEIDQPRYLNTNDFKAAINVSFPLFLRKERGELRISQFKRENTSYKLSQKEWSLTNKIKSLETEIVSLKKQLDIVSDIILESDVMVEAERRLFELGESSIFLINTRENNLIEAQLKKNKFQNDYYKAVANLFEELRINL